MSLLTVRACTWGGSHAQRSQGTSSVTINARTRQRFHGGQREQDGRAAMMMQVPMSAFVVQCPAGVMPGQPVMVRATRKKSLN